MSLLKQSTAVNQGENNSICPFCGYFFKRNEELGLPKEESILYENDYIFVMPDLCPLSVGHLLIISKKHAQGYANTDETTLRAVEHFLAFYEARLGSRKYTIFEHGAVIPYHAGASIDHAHIHIVPYELHLGTKLNSLFPEHRQCELGDLLTFGAANQPYLYYQIRNGKKGVVYPVGEVKSQLLRDVANQCLKNKQFYDWKQTYQGEDAYIEFFKTLVWWKGLKAPLTFKWKKKLVLEKYDLTSYFDILAETNRFQIDEDDLILKLLKKELGREEQISCRLVMVPTKHQYKLPNYVIRTAEDLNGVPAFFQNKHQYQEIWYFTEDSQEYAQVISGRISYHWLRDDYVEYIELICGNTPREIEAYSLNSDSEYMRVSRGVGKTIYRVEAIQLGQTYTSEDQWMQTFLLFRQKLSVYNSRLAHFRSAIKANGISSMSLDFKLSRNRLSFIDWDTSDDSKILKIEIM